MFLQIVDMSLFTFHIILLYWNFVFLCFNFQCYVVKTMWLKTWFCCPKHSCKKSRFLITNIQRWLQKVLTYCQKYLVLLPQDICKMSRCLVKNTHFFARKTTAKSPAVSFKKNDFVDWTWLWKSPDILLKIPNFVAAKTNAISCQNEPRMLTEWYEWEPS